MKHAVITGENVGGNSSASKAKPMARRLGQRRLMYFVQGVSYCVDAGLLTLYFFAGTTTLAVALVYLACGVVLTSTSFILSEIHFNDRFRDHYLTLPQSISNITVQFAAIYLAPEIGYYFVCVIFIILSFGALRMTALQTCLAWTYVTVGLVPLFLFTGKIVQMPMATWDEQAIALACFVTALGRCAFNGLYGSSLRTALYKQTSQLQKANQLIQELAETDELTGMSNRRRILRSLDEEVARAQRNNAPCAVAIIDMDHFKRINDQFGHPAGDDVLRSFTIAICANIRVVDRFGRYGGEEFLLILPDTDERGGYQLLERLRSITSGLDWTVITGSMPVTVSVGMTTIRQADSADTVLGRADAALYRAKDMGRNCVVMDNFDLPQIRQLGR